MDASDNRLLLLLKTYPTMITGFPIAWINATSLELLEDNSRSIQNIQGARAIVDLAANLIGVQKFKNEDIIVITSYNAQTQESDIVI
uniref:DNA2/NAM7 helicase-like C-terminal domain-containing protein n=1 Tax=Romanomermis culicivorax TaxID=13658 RepID=A0A915HWL9_ROMCU